MAVRQLAPRSDEWRSQPVSYVRQVIEELHASDWWVGPCDPREVTILLGDGFALVWDEESGWRLGEFVGGGPERHTELSGVRYLGGGLLPSPERVPDALADARAGVGGCSAWKPCYRSHRNARDGFDTALGHYA